MANLHGMDLKNIVLFEDVFIPFDDNNGLVVVNGLNLDSHEAENTNGAGKSLLFTPLANVLFEATPLSAKKTNKKDLLSEKESSISLRYTGTNEKAYDYKQEASRYVVLEDEVDLGISKQEVAKQKLNQTFPMSQQEFYSTCYIQNLKPLDFQHNTDVDRLKFITDMFDLHIFDHIRQQVHTKLKSIKDAEIEFKTISSQLDEVLRQKAKLEEKIIDSEKVEELSTKESILKKSLNKSIKTQQKLEDLQEKFSKVITLQNKLEALTESLPKKKNLKTYIKKELELIRCYESYETARAEYEKLTESTTKNLNRLEKSLGKNISKDLAEVREAYGIAFDESERLEKQIRSNDKLVKERKELDSEIASLQKQIKKLKVDTKNLIDEDDVALYKNTIQMYKRLKDHDHGDGCPTCGGDVDIKALAKMATKATAKLKLYELQKEHIDLSKELKQAKSQLKSCRKAVDSSDLAAELLGVEKIVDKLEQIGIDLKSYSTEKKIADNLSKPKKQQKPDGTYSQSDLETFLESMQELKVVEAKLETFDLELSFDEKALKKQLKNMEKHIESSSDALEKIQETLSTYKMNKGEIKLLAKQSKKLHKKLSAVEDIVKERRLFEYLYKKYNSNDLKLQAASTIMGILEVSLNTYSSLVFLEKTEFRIRPSKQGVVALYRTANTEKWADIRSLSGAETNCFRLLFAVALLPLIPKQRRTNFIILDEPDAACSVVARQRLIKDFLPKLRSIVPHVFWITPKESDSFKEAEVWTVVKENGASKLIIG